MASAWERVSISVVRARRRVSRVRWVLRRGLRVGSVVAELGFVLNVVVAADGLMGVLVFREG